jgi:uncharacterized membrane protein
LVLLILLFTKEENHVAGLAALLAAGMHVWFAYKETMGWTREFVEMAAPSWIEGVERDLADKHIDWARQLARNIGVYNLMLAVGLAWTSYALLQQSTIGRPLASQFGCWWPQALLLRNPVSSK